MYKVTDMKKKLQLIALLLLILPTLTGCWGQRELTDIAFLTAIGIDREEDGRFRMTVQAINPKNVTSGEQTDGLLGPTVAVYEGFGNTLLEASREVSQHLSRQLNFAHTNLVVVGEETAREGIIDIFDALGRSPYFRTTANIVIARDTTASELLQILTPIDQIPSEKIIKTMEFSEQSWGEIMFTTVRQVVDDIYYRGQQPVITGFIIEGDKRMGKSEEGIKTSKPKAPLSANGIGIFKGDRLIDWVTGEKARGVTWLRNKLQKSIINFDYGDRKEALAYRLLRTSRDISIRVEDETPVFEIDIDSEGNLGETYVPIDLSNPKVIGELEKLVSQEIEKEISETIAYAQKHKTDVFGFGEVLRVQNPKYWKKVEKNWNDVHFQDIDFSVKAHTYIRRTDIRIRPFYYELKKGELEN